LIYGNRQFRFGAVSAAVEHKQVGSRLNPQQKEETMNKVLSTIAFGGLLCVTMANAETNDTAISPDRLTFYEVPLICPAAPEIGCGSRSKPILIQLEREKPVAEAWLNRPGTMIAVVWKPESKRKDRIAAFKAVSEKEELKARELDRGEKAKALKNFLAREGWHRGSDVDRLSEEEAGIIAARLVGRIQAKVSVSDEKAKAIWSEFTGVLKRRFLGTQEKDEQDTEESLLNVLRSHLDEKDVAMLKETLPRSLSPLPGEK